MRRTKPLVKVAAVLLADVDGRHWGYPLSRASGVRSGVLYPMLSRLLEAGWLVDGWEDPTAMTARRAPRRYYQLTELGRLELAAVLNSEES